MHVRFGLIPFSTFPTPPPLMNTFLPTIYARFIFFPCGHCLVSCVYPFHHSGIITYSSPPHHGQVFLLSSSTNSSDGGPIQVWHLKTAFSVPIILVISLRGRSTPQVTHFLPSIYITRPPSYLVRVIANKLKWWAHQDSNLGPAHSATWFFRIRLDYLITVNITCYGAGRSSWLLRRLNSSSSLCTFLWCTKDFAQDCHTFV